jgi:CRISPR-associated protein Cmr6
MARGRVKKWLRDRARGWVVDDADGEECFFTDRSLRGLRPAELRPGLEVEFDRDNNEHGATARNVRRVGARAGPPPRQQGPPRQREARGRHPADVARFGQRGPGPYRGSQVAYPGSQVAYPRRDIAVPRPQPDKAPVEEPPLLHPPEQPLSEVPAEKWAELSPGWVEETADLELVTPALLAGPGQQAGDCDLRSTALAGLLRWWWRTLHAGYLAPQELSLLESMLWGDAHSPNAIQLRITPAPENPPPESFDFEDRHHSIPDLARGGEGQGQRFARPPGCRWQVTVRTGPARFVRPASGPEEPQQDQDIPATEVLDQALAALWLLGHSGGVGWEGQRGFGSLQVQFAGWREPNLVDCLEFGRTLRQRLGLPQEFVPHQAESPALADPERGLIELTTAWTDPRVALEQIDLAFEEFAQKLEPRRFPRSRALPRQTRRPLPRWLISPGAGHPSPIHIHLSRGDGGTLTVRVLTFPTPRSADPSARTDLAQEFLQFLRQESSITVHPTPGRPVPGPAPAGSSQRPPGTVVRVTLLETEPKLGPSAFFVQEEGRGRGILSAGQAPEQLPEIGSQIEVHISSDDPHSPQYRWDLPAEPGGEAGPRRERRPPRPGRRR